MKNENKKRKQSQAETESSKLHKRAGNLLAAAARAMRKISDLSGKNETVLSVNPFGGRPVIIQVFACTPGYFDIRPLTGITEGK